MANIVNTRDTFRAGALENVYFGLVAWGDSTISMRITAPIT